MNCDAVLDKLSSLAEGELPAEEALILRAHVADCPTCGAAYREMGRLIEDLRSLPWPQAPTDLRARITNALNQVDAGREQVAHRSPWEVVGPYVAAAAVVAIAFALATFLSKPRHGGRIARAPDPATQLAAPDGGSPAIATIEAPAAEGATADSAAQPSKETEAAEAAREARKAIQDLQDIESMVRADEALLWPEEMAPGRANGSGTGTGPAAGGIVRMGPSEPPGTKAGTFSAPLRTGEEATPPGPTTPTQIEVGFRPPDDPKVGTTVYGVAEVTAQETLPSATVKATGDSGLAIDKPGGLLYEGPLRAGETVRVPVPMTASKPGLHEVSVKIETDTPGTSTEVRAFVPNFRREAEPRPTPSPADKPVNLVFKNAPVRQALLDIAKQAGLRIEMAEGLGQEKVSRDVRGVPARAALRAVAEAGGYSVQESSGVFRITRTGGSSG